MSSVACPPDDTPPALTAERAVVVSASDLEIAAVRIPSLLACASGRLIAFAEARRNGAGDTGEISVVARVRDEDGRWGAVRSVVHAPGRTMGNPVPLEASDGSIVLLTTSNDSETTEREILSGRVDEAKGRRVHLTRFRCTGTLLELSDATKDITHQVKDPQWHWYATGPGHGVRLPSGRLVVAANHSALDPEGSPKYAAHGLLSEDDGRSWRIGWLTDDVEGASGPNESSLAIGPPCEDGTETMLVTSRNEAPDPECARTIARIPLPGVEQAWVPRSDEVRVLTGFTGPRIQCGLAFAPQGHDVDAFLTGPLRAGARRDLALYAITGDACRAIALLAPGPAGYSDIATADGTIHVLVETGDHRPHERIELLSIPLPEAIAVSGSPKEQ